MDNPFTILERDPTGSLFFIAGWALVLVITPAQPKVPGTFCPGASIADATSDEVRTDSSTRPIFGALHPLEFGAALRHRRDKGKI